MLPYTGFFIPSAIGGGGVSGLSTADGGTAIADNALIRGDGTTGIQGGVLTSADHNGDIAGPTASTDTTVAGSDFANQPSNDSITVASSDAGDTAITVTLIGTTTGTDTVVVEDLPLDGTDATTPVVSAKLNWGQLLAVKVTGTTAGTLTLTETSGAQTITTLAPAATSKGVDTGSISCWNRIPYVVASGASTKQIGLKGTNSAGATIYDSQALTGTTSLLMNSAFVTVTEYYVGDLESTRTVTITAQEGTVISSPICIGNVDTSLHRCGAGIIGIGGASASYPAFRRRANSAQLDLVAADNSGRAYLWMAGLGLDTGATDYNCPVFMDNSGLGNASGVQVRWSNDANDGGQAKDTGLARSAAGVVKVTDGSTGLGSIVASTVKVGGTTSSFPMLSNDLSNIKARKADDSDWVLLKSLGQDVYSSGTSNRLIVLYATSPYEILGLASGVPLGWSSSATDGGTPDTKLVRVAAGQVGIGNATNGQLTNLKTSATTVNLTGATSTATGLFPAKCIQLGVTVRVTTTATSGDGGTSINVGDGSDADRYGATIAFAAGTTVDLSNATADPRGWSASAGDVVFTCVGGTFNAGVARVVAHYLDLTASTS